MMDRIQREKEFHNSRFQNESRGSLSKYYSINNLILDNYHTVLYNKGKGKRILEYGCAMGNQSFILSKFARQLNAIDISEVAIDKARKKASDSGINNIIFDVMNAEDLNFQDNYFDIACGISILHHLDLKSSFRELSRVLKPEGRAYFIEPLGHNPFINLFRKITSSLRTEDEHPLHMKDLRLLSEYFRIDIKYYFFTSLFAVPFRRKKYFVSLLNYLNSVDQFLFKFKLFKLLAWQILIGVSNPQK
jgi:ubiquinone/menaquinone biosynthesis C-methylase UbiE